MFILFFILMPSETQEYSPGCFYAETFLLTWYLPSCSEPQCTATIVVSQHQYHEKNVAW